VPPNLATFSLLIAVSLTSLLININIQAHKNSSFCL
jgi:hypothetical protein